MVYDNECFGGIQIGIDKVIVQRHNICFIFVGLSQQNSQKEL